MSADSGDVVYYSSRFVPFGETVPAVTEPTVLIMPCGPLPPPVEPLQRAPGHIAFENGEWVVRFCASEEQP